MLLLDAGASVQARPEHLVQFAYMGACFMEACVGIERPRVGLLSVGEESGKGTPEVLAAHDRLAEGTLNFAGNVEGFDLPRATVDVVVADGFTGNVALKVLESTVKALTGAIGARVRSGAGLERRRAADPRQAARACATSSTPRAWAARSCSACASPSSWRTAASARAGSRTPCGWRSARSTRTWSGAPPPALEAAGALRSAPAGSVVGATSETSSDA